MTNCIASVTSVSDPGEGGSRSGIAVGNYPVILDHCRFVGYDIGMFYEDGGYDFADFKVEVRNSPCSLMKIPDSLDTCRLCPSGLFPDFVGATCVEAVLCPDDYFFEEGSCTKCNNTLSILFIVFSLALFFVAGKVVGDFSSVHYKMILVKVLSVFFQCSSTTTSINIAWPKIAVSMPFSIPFSASECLSSGTDFNLHHTFLSIFYLPIVLLIII